jgi:pyrroline-5-carboxylate reductase
MRLGFVGTGKIASAMVSGLMTAPSFRGSIVLSPRNAASASQLKAEFPTLTVAASNQEVLDNSETVVLTVRPQSAIDIISELSFRPDHRVISAIAALSHQRLCELVAPAQIVIKAIPLPTVAEHRSFTALYPSEPDANKLFNLLGSAFPVNTERQFNALSATSAVVASYAAFAQATASWLTAQGLGRSEARRYVSTLLTEIVDATADSDRSFSEIAASHTTQGGLNEQLRLYLEGENVFDTLSSGLDKIMARVTGQ